MLQLETELVWSKRLSNWLTRTSTPYKCAIEENGFSNTILQVGLLILVLL